MTLEWNKGFVQSNSIVVLLAFQISNKTKPHQSLCGIFYQYQQWTLVLLTVLQEINRKKKKLSLPFIQLCWWKDFIRISVHLCAF